MRREEEKETDGKRDRGEMRGAIARWTPEGRVYFDNRYHRRRCYRLSYRSAPHTFNGQQMEQKGVPVCVCVCFPCACIEMVAFVTSASFTSPFHFFYSPYICLFPAEPAFKPLCGYYITNDSFRRTRE